MNRKSIGRYDHCHQQQVTQAEERTLETLGKAAMLVVDEEHVADAELRTYVLQQYGQLIKTIFILRYLQSKLLRRKIHAQLNKGELLHALRTWLWFGGDGRRDAV